MEKDGWIGYQVLAKRHWTTCVALLLQQWVVDVKDGLQEAYDHESCVSHFLSEWKSCHVNIKLVGPRKVGIGSGHDAIIIHHNDLLIRNLGLSVAENAVAVHVPGILYLMVVQNTLLVGHDLVIIRFG